MIPPLNQSWLEIFRKQKAMAEKAIAQVSDDDLWKPAIRGTNSIGVIMRHMASSMASRWTDFLTTDGEKDWRDREAEFNAPPIPRAELAEMWERSWSILFDTLDALTHDDLVRTVTIRDEPHTIPQAVNRQIDHYAFHIGQITLIARAHVGEKWEWLTVPPGESERFTREMREKYKS